MTVHLNQVIAVGWIAAGCVACGLPRSAQADPTFMFHITDVNYSGCGTLDSTTLSCSGLKASSPSTVDEFTWILVGDVGGGIGGVQFGIEYDGGVQVAQWTLCSGGAEIIESGWPSSGTGTAATWADGCFQTGGADLAAVGFLYVRSGSSGYVRAVDDPRISDSIMTDCSATLQTTCEFHGVAGFGGTSGFVPERCGCGGPPVETDSWGTIKSRFGR